MSAIAESATTCVMSVSDNVLRVVVPTFCSYRIRAVVRIVCNYYPNVTTLLPGLCYRKSVCRLSVVCNVRDPYSLSAIFLCHFVYLSHPLTSVQNFMEIVPGEPPPPSGALNARGVAKCHVRVSHLLMSSLFIYMSGINMTNWAAGVQRAGGEGERMAATERAPASQDVWKYRGQRSLWRSRRHQQELLLWGRPQQTTHAQSVHPGSEVNRPRSISHNVNGNR